MNWLNKKYDYFFNCFCLRCRNKIISSKRLFKGVVRSKISRKIPSLLLTSKRVKMLNILLQAFDFPSVPGVANEILENEAKSCSPVA